MYAFLSRFTLAVALVSTIVSCNSNSQDTPPEMNAVVTEYVAAFTSGVVSKKSTIRVIFTRDIPVAKPGAEVEEDWFSFKPRIKGKTLWIDARTIEFIPNENLPSGELYNGDLDLTDFFDDLPEDFEELPLHFQVIEQGIHITAINTHSYNNTQLKWNWIGGSIFTNDITDVEELEDFLAAEQNNNDLKVTWLAMADNKNFKFTIDSILRTDKVSEVDLEWNTDWVLKNERERVEEIPALGDFKIMDISAVSQPDQYVLITFSDPLDESQNLRGLVTVSQTYGLKYEIINNQIKVLFNNRVSSTKKVTVFPGIKNILQYQFKDDYSVDVVFDEDKPEVQFVSSGDILPGSGDKIIPFKAVNLKAVDVTIYQIYEDNIFQFLQVNNTLGGKKEIKRVARPIARKVVKLYGENAKNLHNWNNFALDLTDLIKAEPGAIYRIQLGFRQEYSIYNCANGNDDLEVATDETEKFPFEENYDTPFERNYYYWWGYEIEDYSWREKDNPCNASYYTPDRFVHQNLLASNVAITVKGSKNNKYLAVVTDIVTGKPMTGVTVNFYNYQQQVVGKGTTNGEGFLEISTHARAFLAVADVNGDRAYKRLAEGNALSMSNFEISGADVSRGHNGMIYTERGVWRPGDSIYLNFILQDKDMELPNGHPLIFELYDPSGNMVEREVKRTSGKHIYKFWTRTLAASPTGNYNARVKIGGATYYKRLKIETVKPNRLRIAFEFEDEVLMSLNTVNLHTEWLTGATAKNLRAKIESRLRVKTEPFERFKEYTFIDPSRSFYSYDRTLFDGKVNAEGDAVVSIELAENKQAPGMLEAVFYTTVFEAGGDFSTDVVKKPYAPFSSFVGLKSPKPTGYYLETDKPLSFELVTLTPEGKPENHEDLEVDIYKIDWSWWWSSTNRNLVNYLNSEYKEVVFSKKVSMVNGKASFNFEVKYPEYGRYFVRVCDPVSGHCTGEMVYIDWPWGQSKTGRTMPGAATMLLFNADKEKYKVGESGELTIPTAQDGKLLVTFETGAEVLSHQWVDAKKGVTKVPFKITEDMAPNVYAFVSYIQPHANTANDLPVRMYGVIPIEVENANAKLEPVIKMPDVLEPETDFSITVKEKNGKPMTYTIAVVDEGLLNLTRFKTPDPYKYFFAKQALGVHTWDIFDEVIGAYGGKIEQMFAIGGDDELSEEEKKSKRFKPVVRFIGPFTLEKGESQTHQISMPNYIGSVRTMVVAANQKAYGSAEKNTPVKKPLMVYGTLPRVVGPGETIKLPVQVFALENFVKNVKVTVKTNGMFNVATEVKSLKFKEIGDKMLAFELEVLDKTGLGKITVTATSGKQKSVYEVEIAVRNANNYQVNSTAFVLNPGESLKEKVEAFGTEGTNSFAIEVAQFPELNINENLRRLIRYPHGCMEQSTSAIMPQIALLSFLDNQPDRKSEIHNNINAFLNKVKLNQHYTGGIKLWQSDINVDLWVTSYTAHALLLAENHGYNWPVGMKKAWVNFQQQKARSWRRPVRNSNAYYYRNEDQLQAYRLYVLALAGNAEFGAMNRLRQLNDLDRTAKWRLAVTYAIAGQKNTANKMIEGLGVTTSSYRFSALTYGSALRDKAMILEALVELKKNDLAFEMAMSVARELNNGNWYSTQTTAYALLGLSKFLENKESDKAAFAYKINGKGETINTTNPVYSVPVNSSLQSGFTLDFTNNSKDKLYVIIVNEGQPKAGSEKPILKGLSVNVRYTDRNGATIDVSKLKQGTDFKAIVEIDRIGGLNGYQNMALTQVFSSGWEIINLRLMDRTNESEDKYRYRDYRDDRVMTYFNLPYSRAVRYEIWLNASYAGKYYLPGPKVEDMYDNRIEAILKGEWIEVK